MQPSITVSPCPDQEPLTIVAVDKTSATLSTGEVVLVRYEKLRALCEQLQQEAVPVSVRLWWTREKDAMVAELIEAHRLIFPVKRTETIAAETEVF